MFNWFDLVLGVIVMMSIFAGLRAGFARVVVGLVAAIVGLLAGFWCYRLVAVKLTPWVRTPTIANILGFLAIFVVVLILGSLISALLSRIFKWIGLSWFNHLLGGAAGLARGAVIIAAVADAVVAFSPSPPPTFLNDSKLLPYTAQLSSWLADIAPRELKDAFDEQMQTIRRFWNPEKGRPPRQV
jgi:membrane protein required for colicin V production